MSKRQGGMHDKRSPSNRPSFTVMRTGSSQYLDVDIFTFTLLLCHLVCFTVLFVL